MSKKMTARNSKVSGSSRKRVAKDSYRLVKAIVLLVLAALSLTAGIYKGGEGLFFGVVFALGCGLLGFLFFLPHDNKTTKARRK